MKLALIGFPQSGKTTAFQALAGHLPSHPTDPNKAQLASLTVQDDRLLSLSKLTGSKKVTFGQLILLDSPLLTSHPDQGLNFSQVREADGFVTVVDGFSGSDPLSNGRKMEGELIRQDLDGASASLDKITKEIAKGRKEREKELQVLSKCKSALQENRPLRTLELTEDEKKLIGSYTFLSLKPNFVVINLSEEAVEKKEGALPFAFCAKIEKELWELPQGDREEFMKGVGLDGFSQQRFCAGLLAHAGFVTFFTLVGEEARAWFLERGRTVLEAAGKIHTDMAKGFIKAEVISAKELMALGSLAKAREKGTLRLESKEYVVQDGDVLNIRFSV